jgi:acyl-CoA thioesterase-2
MAYACDQVMLEPVLRRHGQSWASPGLTMATLDHAMWWHRPARVDEWLLYVQNSPSAHGGRGLSTAKVFTQDGNLAATIAQDGMFRLP